MASKQEKAPAEARYADFDPKFEWQENAASYVLRINLPGFKKEDFRVQVDASGKLTVRGQRPVGDGKYSRFHKAFQLPDISNLDEISGRFEANVLSLTVPKKPAAPPTELAPPKEEEEKKEEEHVKPKEEPKKAEKPKPTVEPTPSLKEEEEKAKPKEEPKKLEEQKKEAAAAAPMTGQRPKVDVDGEKKEHQKAILECLLERAKRREEERAAAAEEREKKAARNWKERVAEELEGLSDFKWADSLLEKINKNKEVIIAAAAVFSVGFFVSHKLFSKK